MRTLVILSTLLEAAFLLGGGAYALYRLRRRRLPGSAQTHSAQAGEGRRPAPVLGRLEKVLTMGLPLPLARLLMAEPRMSWCLGRWVLRRRPRGTNSFSYHKRSLLGAMIVVVLFTTPVEVLLFELLIPVLWIRVALLVAAVYGLFFVVGMYAALVVLPHQITGEGLLLRYGALAELWVPFERIVGATTERREGPRGSLGFSREGLSMAADEASFVMGGRTDLVLDFDRPLPVARLRGDRPVRRVFVAADAPEALLKALRVGMEHMAATTLRPPAAQAAPTASRQGGGEAARADEPPYVPGHASSESEAEASSSR